MDVVVTDVAEDCVSKIAAAQRVLIEAQHARESLIGNSHVSRDFALAIAREPLIHQYRQRVTELAQFCLVGFIRCEPGFVGEGVMTFQQA